MLVLFGGPYGMGLLNKNLDKGTSNLVSVNLIYLFIYFCIGEVNRYHLTEEMYLKGKSGWEQLHQLAAFILCQNLLWTIPFSWTLVWSVLVLALVATVLVCTDLWCVVINLFIQANMSVSYVYPSKQVKSISVYPSKQVSIICLSTWGNGVAQLVERWTQDFWHTSVTRVQTLRQTCEFFWVKNVVLTPCQCAQPLCVYARHR